MNNGPTPERAGPDRHTHSHATARDGQSPPSVPHHDAERVLAFAQAVAMPDTLARYLEPGSVGRNSKVVRERADIASAAASGRPFMVAIARNVLAIDADAADHQLDLRHLHQRLEVDLRNPVMVDSGRGLHVFAKMPVGAVRRFGARARSLGLDVREDIRPPLSPHPYDRVVDLVGLSYDAALRRLEGPVAGPIALSRRMVHLLNDGANHDYASDSEAVQALATAMLACGWPRGRYVAALLGTAHWSKAATRHGGEQWLLRSWTSARQYLKSSNRGEDEQLDEIVAAANATEWAGAAGRRNRRLLDAHHRAAFDSPYRSHILTTSQAAASLGVSHRTVRNARGDLLLTGWLASEKDGFGAQAAEWSIRVPVGLPALPDRGAEVPDAQTCRPVVHTPLPATDTASTRTTEDREASTRALLRDLGHDAFRVGALGKCAPEILEVLIDSSGEPLTGAEIARRCPSRPHPETVRRALRRSRESGIAVESTTGWLLVNLSEEGLLTEAETSGTSGMRERQVFLDEIERKRRQAERSEWRPLGQVAQLVGRSDLTQEDALWLPVAGSDDQLVHEITGERTSLFALRNPGRGRPSA